MEKQSFSSSLKKSGQFDSECQLKFSGLTDPGHSKQIARKLFDQYDRNRDSNIDRTECVSMIIDTYRSFNRQYNPQSQDIDNFYKVLDRNRDGKVGLADVEALCHRYLVAGQMTRFGEQSLSASQIKPSESSRNYQAA